MDSLRGINSELMGMVSECRWDSDVAFIKPDIDEKCMITIALSMLPGHAPALHTLKSQQVAHRRNRIINRRIPHP